VLALLFVLGAAMRNAPARFLNLLWWLGLAKLFLPLPLLGSLGGHALRPIIRTLLPAFREDSLAGSELGTVLVWLRNASAALDPIGPVLHAPSSKLASLEPLFVILTAFWFAGALWFALRWARGRIRGRSSRELNRGIPVPLAPLAIRRRIAAALHGTRIPPSAIRVIREPVVPGVAGFFRPRILVSRMLIGSLGARALRGILLHEDEHRRRYDPLRAILQRAAVIAFFYYPLLWPLLRRIRTTAEIACDEVALRCGISPRTYTRALADTLALGLGTANPSTGISLRESSLIRCRLHRLEQHGRYVAMRRYRFALAAGALLVALTSLSPSFPAIAASDGDQAAQEPPVPTSVVPATYPDDARAAGAEGMVVLVVIVGEDGNIAGVSIKESVPGWPSFADSASAAAWQWEFEPATSDGEPVEIKVLIAFQFVLD
jgi:TonB family protein